jgi:aminobenzoyl-glutamate utilization protein B
MKRQSLKSVIKGFAQARRNEAAALADQIVEFAEPGFQEFRSSKAIADYLAQNGFKVVFPWPHMPTAFKATWGSGGPKIGLLAEYDALPNCGLKPGTWGHGCSHNLLGVGSATAAIIVKQCLEKLRRKGRIVVWGSPAEELLAGKVYMARDRAFRDNDAILAWHPAQRNDIQGAGGSALDSILFEYFGKTAHAAYADYGRSALDGVILLDVAANYLREHIPENVRIHMCIRSGGDAPNVVPGYAKSWYYIRGKDRKQVDDIRKRLIACAKGAAMATGTRLKATLLTAVYQRLPNHTLNQALFANLKLFGPNLPTEQDMLNAKKLGRKPIFETKILGVENLQGRASSDNDNASWLAPLGAELRVACVAKGTTGHHRDNTAQMRLPFAHSGMMRAAEVLAATVLDLCLDRRLLAKARAEFAKGRKGQTYDPMIPRSQKPPSVDP